MIKEHLENSTKEDLDFAEKGDQVMQQIGVLKERVQDLKETPGEAEVDPEKVGKWVTAIGRAVLAILKP